MFHPSASPDKPHRISAVSYPILPDPTEINPFPFPSVRRHSILTVIVHRVLDYPTGLSHRIIPPDSSGGFFRRPISQKRIRHAPTRSDTQVRFNHYFTIKWIVGPGDGGAIWRKPPVNCAIVFKSH